MEERFAVHAVFPNYYDGTWVSYSLKSVVDNMQGAHSYVLGKAASVRDARVSALLPNVFYQVTSRLLHDRCDAIVRRYARRIKRGDVVHFWMTSPVPVVQRLQKKGVFVVREMINCARLMRRRELRSAYALLGQPDLSDISDEAIQLERSELLAVDAVFCPNDFVLESVREYGVPLARCIPTSYGWGPERIEHAARKLKGSSGIDVLFVGTGEVRKGLPWLLEAWAQSGVNGRLLLAGGLEAGIRTRYAQILARNDVRQLGFVRDIGAAYRSADIFCFPSWEEGGPLVTIEAMASGLPCVVTPMGGAGLIKKTGDGGIVIRPGDVKGISSALRSLAENESKRRELGETAKTIAMNYTWNAVGARRLRALKQVRAARDPKWTRES